RSEEKVDDLALLPLDHCKIYFREAPDILFLNYNYLEEGKTNLASKRFFEKHEINDQQFLFQRYDEDKDDSYKCIGFISYEKDDKEEKGRKGHYTSSFYDILSNNWFYHNDKTSYFPSKKNKNTQHKLRHNARIFVLVNSKVFKSLTLKCKKLHDNYLQKKIEIPISHLPQYDQYEENKHIMKMSKMLCADEEFTYPSEVALFELLQDNKKKKIHAYWEKINKAKNGNKKSTNKKKKINNKNKSKTHNISARSNEIDYFVHLIKIRKNNLSDKLIAKEEIILKDCSKLFNKTFQKEYTNEIKKCLYSSNTICIYASKDKGESSV
ncbi:MAG: hypothetical protein GY828_03275, partial [Candidatus Gracilibacteria bacterium]|nr:hypothetical protein [Candidatus Gracilibacteria bacterium]